MRGVESRKKLKKLLGSGSVGTKLAARKVAKRRKSCHYWCYTMIFWKGI